MSETTTPRKGFNKKPKFQVGKVKFTKKKSSDSNDVSERTERRRPRTNSRDGVDGKDSSDTKRKRVYAERGDFSNGDAHNKKSFSRKGKEEGFKRKSHVKDDVSDFDKLNRMKFSSRKDENSGGRSRKKEFESPRGYKGRGGSFDGKSTSARNTRRDEFSVERSGTDGFESWKGYKGKDGTFNSRSIRKEGISEERSRKKEFESPRGYKGGADRFDGKSLLSRGKERMRRDEDVDRKAKSKVKTRERSVSTKRDLDDESDTNFNSQAKTRDRRSSVKQEDVSRGKLKMKDKPRDRGVSTRQDDVQDDLQKQNSKKKTDSNKQLPPKASNLAESGALEKSTKKQLRPKKYKDEDSSEDGPPKKKKKKVMRIAPDDISNKRIDDGISFDGKAVEKTVDPDEKLEMSKNAQFRAIQPSPSILSFVEENLLGRRRSIDLRRAGYNIDLSAPLDNIPLSTSTERERIEEAVFRNKLEFFAAAKVASSFPPAELPEIAFAGRSNVGKSSLLNALTRQWGVVRTSDKPGLTQTINFFKLGTKLSMVDLPGYGFAYAKEEVKDAWEELVKEYVSTRVGLKRVCLLIDTKWGMKPRDHELINLMERSQTKYQIVLTKSDLAFPIDVARRAMQIEETLKAHKSVVQPVMMISSKSGGGIRSLRTVLAKIARLAK